MHEEYLLSLLLYCNICKITILIGEVWDSAIKVHIYLHYIVTSVSVSFVFLVQYIFKYFDKHFLN